MAFVKWMPGVEYVSGALSKINKKSPHAADQTMLLATHRKAATTSKKCTGLFVRTLSSITRSTPVSQDEMARRTRFGAIGAAVQARKKNMSYITSDVQNFQAQKETGYKTLYQYLWHLCADAYDQSNG